MLENNYTRLQTLKTDQQMLWILLAHVPVVGLLIPLGFGSHGFALTASILLGAIVLAAYVLLRGSRNFSVLVAAALMAFSAIMIQSRLGQIEMHFHIFAALALVMIYRDWLPVVVGAAVIAVHHLILTGLQLAEAGIAGMPVMIFSHGGSWGIAFLHAAFVVFEASILTFFARRLGRERGVADGMMDVVAQFNGEQDLAGRLDATGEPSARAFNSLMDQFSALVLEASGLARQLAQSATELTSSSDRANTIIDRQRVDLEQAASATEQMSATVQEVAQNAQQTSEASATASRSASHGKGRVAESVSLTESTDAALDVSAGAVRSLADNVASINRVIGSIDDISEQTNLLALNAAIEAARAGEHGRGFAVVADEVRSLSRRTQAFTSEIRETIETLSRGADSALQAIDDGQARSRQTTAAIRDAGEAMDTVGKGLDEVTDRIYQIASAAEQQAATSTQINASVQGVAERNRDVLEQADEVRQLATGLETLVGQVNGLVSGYRLP
ncbi:methyl-accepting chemotaxis protein [Marinobacter zhanjiangensis]|uniref:Methyl-accepting chemotaxis protein n=1 Tax=Marinobacter zhanjiangensis TaxID=578215 RepID=A0ABQ3AZS1_9GAMM|nr:methyl-accepting chemotaxis protein [Marinobacter zhanjiangensis]GGY71841.1 methyl-accepting chemotaxis protein [Marinobacter zhanjiangensis]